MPPDENKRRSIESLRSPIRASALELIAANTTPAHRQASMKEDLEYFMVEIMLACKLTIQSKQARTA
jgi:hypothetical protein